MTVVDERPTRATMETVVVDKAKLMEKLTENRAAHRAIFEEALAGYQTRAIEILNDHLKRIKAGKVEVVFVQLPVPSDHTDDYDRAIATLEWTLFDEVELTIREFDMYVRDSWAWRQEFLTSNSVYSESASASLRRH